MSDFVTIDEAARVTGLTYWTVYGMIRRGEIKPAKFGRSFAFTDHDLERLRALSRDGRRNAG